MRCAWKKVEDCFDGSQVFDCLIQCPVSISLINSLENLGELEYYPDFPRPFFRAFTLKESQIKGVLGEMSFRVYFSKEEVNDGREVIENHIRAFYNKNNSVKGES